MMKEMKPGTVPHPSFSFSRGCEKYSLSLRCFDGSLRLDGLRRGRGLRLSLFERLLTGKDEQACGYDDEDSEQSKCIRPLLEEERSDGQGPEDLAVLCRSEAISRRVHCRDDEQSLSLECRC